nr:uncharacterized protein LOC109175453 [Ipomoea batatas]
MGKIESQRSVFDRLGSNPQAPKRKSIHDRLGVVQDVKNNGSHPVEAEPSKRPRSMIPSRENEESVVSSDDVTPPQGEEASSFHITLCDEIPIQGDDAEEAPHELEEGVRAAIDELKEVDLGTPENPRPIFINLSPLRKAYLHLHLSTWESPECVSLFLRQKSQPLVMCRAVLEPQSQVLGALAFHHGSWSTPPLNPLWSTALCFISWICLPTLPLKEETLSAGVSFRFLQISFQMPMIMAIYFDMKESALGRIET